MKALTQPSHKASNLSRIKTKGAQKYTGNRGKLDLELCGFHISQSFFLSVKSSQRNLTMEMKILKNEAPTTGIDSKGNPQVI